MAKHPSRRPKREEEQEDVFVARVLEYTEWVRRNARIVTVVAVVVVVAVAAILYYRNYRASLAERATAQLAEIRQTAASGNLDLAKKDLETFVSSYSGTAAGQEGRLALAQIDLRQGHAQEALKAVEPLARDLDDPLGVSAAFLLGAAQETADDPAAAEKTYMRIADGAGMQYQVRRALEEAARIRSEQNDPAGAAQLYERLLAMTPENDPQHGVYAMRLAEARSRTETEGGETAAPSPAAAESAAAAPDGA